MTIMQPDQFSFTKILICLFIAVQLVACGGGGGGDTSSEALLDEVVLDEVVLDEVVPGEAVPGNVVPSSIAIAWTAPVARADETPLSLAEIGGYRIYYGTSEGDYPNRIDVNDGSAVEATLSDLASGTYYIVVTTYDTAGRESEFSPVLVKAI